MSTTTTEKARTKLWIAVRIDGYRIQLLTNDEEWEEFSENTLLEFDRETVYQAARANNGLLCRADGVMSAGQASRLKDRVRELLAAEAAQVPPAHGGSDEKPQEPQETAGDALPGSEADLRNKRLAAAKALKDAAKRTDAIVAEDQDPLPY